MLCHTHETRIFWGIISFTPYHCHSSISLSATLHFLSLTSASSAAPSADIRQWVLCFQYDTLWELVQHGFQLETKKKEKVQLLICQCHGNLCYTIIIQLVHSWHTGGKPKLECQWCFHTVSLYCTALHLQTTRRHCIKFIVAPMSIIKVTKSTTESPSVVFDSHRCVGKLPSSYSSTVSICWIQGLYHVSAHSTACLIILMADTSSSSRPCYVAI